MTIIEKKEITGVRTEPGRMYEDIELTKCELGGCIIGSWDRPENRVTIRNVVLKKCKHAGNMILCAALENIVVDDLSTGNSLMCYGVALKHVVLKGKIGRICIWGDHVQFSDQPELDELYAIANAEYYRTVDWALDIREVKAVDLDINGIPIEKILRDPETQKVIYPEDFVDVDYRELGFESAITGYISRAKRMNEPTIVIAPLANKTQLPRYLRDFEVARKLGLLRE